MLFLLVLLYFFSHIIYQFLTLYFVLHFYQQGLLVVLAISHIITTCLRQSQQEAHVGEALHFELAGVVRGGGGGSGQPSGVQIFRNLNRFEQVLSDGFGVKMRRKMWVHHVEIVAGASQQGGCGGKPPAFSQLEVRGSRGGAPGSYRISVI